MLKSGFTDFQPTLTFEHGGKSYFKFELSHDTRVKQRYMNESKPKYNDSNSKDMINVLKKLKVTIYTNKLHVPLLWV